MAEMDFRGQEALCSERVELYGHSNHIHFFVIDKGAREVIPKSIHLIARSITRRRREKVLCGKPDTMPRQWKQATI